MRELTEAFVILALSLIGDLLYIFKDFLINNRFVGITDDNPVFFVHIGLSLSFIEGLLFSALNHMTYVNGVCQYALYNLRMPQHTLVFLRFDLAGLVEICRGRKNTGIIESASNLYHADTLGTPLEYLTDGRCGFLVDNKVVFVVGVFTVPIRCPRSDELAVLLLNVKCRCGFLDISLL